MVVAEHVAGGGPSLFRGVVFVLDAQDTAVDRRLVLADVTRRVDPGVGGLETAVG
jgi:hypothetical protein